MFSYVFMKILEGRPHSYDRRISCISGGRSRQMKEKVIEEIAPGSEVLEIGCGTGELAAMLIASHSTVHGFDINPAMVAEAQDRAKNERLNGKLRVQQMGVDGMDSLPAQAYDAVVSTLVFSELSGDERRFALQQAARVLRAGGLLVVADEVVPRSLTRRLFHAFFRIPLLVVTYLVSGTSTQPVRDLSGDILRAGFDIEKDRRSRGDTFAVVVARWKGAGEDR